MKKYNILLAFTAFSMACLGAGSAFAQWTDHPNSQRISAMLKCSREFARLGPPRFNTRYGGMEACIHAMIAIEIAKAEAGQAALQPGQGVN